MMYVVLVATALAGLLLSGDVFVGLKDGRVYDNPLGSIIQVVMGVSCIMSAAFIFGVLRAE